MHTRLAHIQFNVRPDNVSFYADLMAFLGWSTLYANEGMVGVAGQSGDSLWFVGQVKAVENDYDGPGMNHLAFGAASPAGFFAIYDPHTPVEGRVVAEATIYDLVPTLLTLLGEPLAPRLRGRVLPGFER